MGIQRTYKPTELHILISVNKARMSGLLVPSYRTGFGFDTIAHDRRAFELLFERCIVTSPEASYCRI